MRKIRDDLPALRRMGHFRMELQAEDFLVVTLNRGAIGIFRHGDRFKPVRNFGELVAVGIPDLQGFGQLGEKLAEAVLHSQHALAIFAL